MYLYRVCNVKSPPRLHFPVAVLNCSPEVRKATARSDMGVVIDMEKVLSLERVSVLLDGSRQDGRMKRTSRFRPGS